VLTLSGALMIFSLRNRPAHKVLRLGASLLAVGVALILAAVHSASLPLFFIATLIAGSGFGAGFLGALRSVVPLALPHERAGLMSAFYVLSYLAFCLPSLLAGNLIRSFWPHRHHRRLWCRADHADPRRPGRVAAPGCIAGRSNIFHFSQTYFQCVSS